MWKPTDVGQETFRRFTEGEGSGSRMIRGPKPGPGGEELAVHLSLVFNRKTPVAPKNVDEYPTCSYSCSQQRPHFLMGNEKMLLYPFALIQNSSNPHKCLWFLFLRFHLCFLHIRPSTLSLHVSPHLTPASPPLGTDPDPCLGELSPSLHFFLSFEIDTCQGKVGFCRGLRSAVRVTALISA